MLPIYQLLITIKTNMGKSPYLKCPHCRRARSSRCIYKHLTKHKHWIKWKKSLSQKKQKKTKKTKKNKEKIPSGVRHSVWTREFGNRREGMCYCCGTEPITVANFHCGHIRSEKNGGKVELDNLRPICMQCNLSMGTMEMHHYMKKHGYSIRRREENFKEKNNYSPKNLPFLSRKTNYLSNTPPEWWSSTSAARSTKVRISYNKELLNKLNAGPPKLSKTPNFDNEEKWFKKIYLRELIHNLNG